MHEGYLRSFAPLKKLKKAFLVLEDRGALAASIAATRINVGLSVANLSIKDSINYRKHLLEAICASKVWVCYPTLMAFVVHGHRLDDRLMGQASAFFDAKNMCAKHPQLSGILEDLRISGHCFGNGPPGPAKQIARACEQLKWKWKGHLCFEIPSGIVLNFEKHPPSWLAHEVREAQRAYLCNLIPHTRKNLGGLRAPEFGHDLYATTLVLRAKRGINKVVGMPRAHLISCLNDSQHTQH